MATMKARPDGNASKALSERSKEAQVHIDRIRTMLNASNTALDVKDSGEKGTAAGAPANA